MFFFFKQKTAYEIGQGLEFRRVLFRSGPTTCGPGELGRPNAAGPHVVGAGSPPILSREEAGKDRKRVVEGKRVELGGRRIIKKKKIEKGNVKNRDEQVGDARANDRVVV